MSWRSWIFWPLGVFLTGNLAFAASLCWPGWAFSHQGGSDRLRIHSAEPLPPEAAIWAVELMASLDASALPPGPKPIDIYITGDGWRYDWFFAGARGAAGLVYGPAPGRRVFLAGADFAADALLIDGQPLRPPRTLSYFASHEISHLTQIATLGRWRYLSFDPEIREGMADYIALGPAPAELLTMPPVMGRPSPELQEAYGAYPFQRAEFTRLSVHSRIDELMLQRR